jgi:hypothetical protein
MHARRLAALLALSAATGAALAQAAEPCPVQGEAVQWVADWCMATLQTDDEIAASDCIALHPVSSFASACAAKVHFKLELCRLSGAPQAAPEALQACVDDPRVMGRTVREGGVGGR